jgi:hypothetical protein
MGCHRSDDMPGTGGWDGLKTNSPFSLETANNFCYQVSPMNDPFEKLSPFEKTVLLELARTQSFASAAFQIASKGPNEVLPPSREILNNSFEDALTGILKTLRENQS